MSKKDELYLIEVDAEEFHKSSSPQWIRSSNNERIMREAYGVSTKKEQSFYFMWWAFFFFFLS